MLGDLNMTLTGATTKLLIALASLCVFPLSVGWTENSLVHIAQTLASSTRLTECWICLPRAKFIMGHGDPFIHPIRNLGQIPDGKWFSTRDPSLQTLMYGQNCSFSYWIKSNVSCLTQPSQKETWDQQVQSFHFGNRERYADLVQPDSYPCLSLWL